MKNMITAYNLLISLLNYDQRKSVAELITKHIQEL